MTHPMPRRWKVRLPLILGAVLFALSAYTAFFDGETGLALLDGAVAILNLVALRLIDRMPAWTDFAVNLANAVAALAMAVTLFAAGKTAVQYAWLVAAVLYLVVAFLRLRRSP